MWDPFIILEVDVQADDAAIRAAYLEKIKQFPPERDPAQFSRVNEAYEKIKTRPKRLRYMLFDTDMPGDSPLEVVVEWHRQNRGRALPPSFGALKKHLRECMRETWEKKK